MRRSEEFSYSGDSMGSTAPIIDSDSVFPGTEIGVVTALNPCTDTRIATGVFLGEDVIGE
jgi:hypothetical protein